MADEWCGVLGSNGLAASPAPRPRESAKRPASPSMPKPLATLVATGGWRPEAGIVSKGSMPSASIGFPKMSLGCDHSILVRLAAHPLSSRSELWRVPLPIDEQELIGQQQRCVNRPRIDGPDEPDSLSGSAFARSEESILSRFRRRAATESSLYNLNPSRGSVSPAISALGHLPPCQRSSIVHRKACGAWSKRFAARRESPRTRHSGPAWSGSYGWS